MAESSAGLRRRIVAALERGRAERCGPAGSRFEEGPGGFRRSSAESLYVRMCLCAWSLCHRPVFTLRHLRRSQSPASPTNLPTPLTSAFSAARCWGPTPGYRVLPFMRMLLKKATDPPQSSRSCDRCPAVSHVLVPVRLGTEGVLGGLGYPVAGQCAKSNR